MVFGWEVPVPALPEGAGLPLFLAGYGVLLVFVVVSVLCGETEALERTCFGKAHRCLLGGWYEALVSLCSKCPLAGRLCGEGLERLEHECCGRPM